MKKAILILALIGLSLSVMAQTVKKDTAKKPVVQTQTPAATEPKYPGVPLYKRVTLTITLPVYMLDDFAMVNQVGQAGIDNSDQITAQRRTFYVNNHKAVLDTLTAKWNAFLLKDQTRWLDSVKRAKTVKK